PITSVSTPGRIWPVAAALAVAAAYPLAMWRHAQRWPMVLIAGLCALLALGGLLVSFSKGALLGLLAAGLVLLFFASRSLAPRRRWLILGGSLLAGVLLLTAVALVLGVERLNPLGETSAVRLKTWSASLTMIGDHPLVGIGLDQFGQFYPDYMDPSLAQTNERFTSHPHNLLLDIWLRLGIMGIVAISWLLIRFYRRILHPTGDALPSIINAGIAAAMTAALVHGLVDNVYFVPDLAFAFWLLLLLRFRET
ncbi:MAG: O-antigen ligase family protein, partial [Chloroflexaceae bacterium]|nr:O-antigen ligase family protein [Chloroflexaceae bacterium]